MEVVAPFHSCRQSRHSWEVEVEVVALVPLQMSCWILCSLQVAHLCMLSSPLPSSAFASPPWTKVAAGAQSDRRVPKRSRSSRPTSPASHRVLASHRSHASHRSLASHRGRASHGDLANRGLASRLCDTRGLAAGCLWFPSPAQHIGGPQQGKGSMRCSSSCCLGKKAKLTVSRVLLQCNSDIE